ncbi:glutamyl-tRNA reductase [uncultured Clostridium sp.]|uniref:glutamyl-tRNA reductase n=1 Tax=uncultured Clostridium sp. TaxID=59620 RepID=UPI0032165B84
MIHLIGIKKELDLILRGQLAISQDNIDGILLKMKETICEEVVIINTCNRTEIYLKSSLSQNNIIQEVFKSLNWDKEFIKYIFYSNDSKAITHLLEVSCGFHSKILGEDQILGQVKDAYIKSKELKVIKASFDKLFSMAISCGKEFKTESKLHKTPVSYSSIAAKKALDQGCKNILILGFGKMAQLTLNYLIGKQDILDKIYIVVRNTDKVINHSTIIKNIELTVNKKIEIISIDNLVDTYKYIDALICCTASPTPLVLKKDLPSQSMLIFDLSLPINVEDSCSELKNVCLFNLDNLQNVDKENKIQRRNIMNSNKYIIKKYYDEYENFLKLKSLSGIIKDVKDEGQLLVENNLKTFKNKKYTKDNDKLVATLLKSSANTYINRAIEVLKQETLKGDNEDVYKLIERIFLNKIN